MQFDKKYLNIALFSLEKIIGSTFPNPPVFALLVESDKSFKDNKIVSFGYTSPSGRPHAEANAIENFTFRKNKIYSLYSTLEPCCHEGRDESCVSKILKSKKISRVIFSLIDPDKRVNGKGKKILKKNYLEVKSGMLKNKTKVYYEGYILNRQENRPKIILKLAMTKDNYITLKKGQRTKITNSISDKYSDTLRSEVDAILVGSKTVSIDNCILKCKMPSLINNSPTRIVLNRKLDLNTNSKIFENCKRFKTILFTSNTSKKLIKNYEKKSVEVIFLKKEDYTLVNILKKLSDFGISNLLVEGGGKIFKSFLKENLFDYIYIFRSNFFSGIKNKRFSEAKIDVSNFKLLKNYVKQFGDDSLEIYKN